MKRLSSFRVCNKSNTTDATRGPETSHHSGAAEVIPGVLSHSCCSIFNFLGRFCRSHLFFCPISFGHYIVCYSSIDLLLLVTSLVSSDVSHYTCSVIHNNLIFLCPFCKSG